MARHTLPDIAEAMARIDFSMLFTHTDGGALAGRPMSNNGEVEFDGDAYFFAYDSARSVRDIAADRRVALSCQGSPGLLGKPPIFIAIQGEGALIRDKTVFAVHWSKGLDRWFPRGIDTPGLILIKVSARRIHVWDGEDEDEIVLSG
jgi:general stress protein 26